MGNARWRKLAGSFAIGLVAVCVSAGAADSTPAPATRPATTRAATLYERLEACPVMVGTFMKVGVTRYKDPLGEDVSVGYNFFRGLMYTSIACTAYFYPLPEAGTPTAFEKHRAYELKVLAAAHPDARIVSTEKTVLRQRGEDYEGAKVVLEYQGPFGTTEQPQELRSELYLFRRGAQVVKYRITYPANESAEATGRIDKFLADFAWPEL